MSYNKYKCRCGHEVYSSTQHIKRIYKQSDGHVCSLVLTEEVSADQTDDDKYDFVDEMSDEELDDFIDAQMEWQNEVDRAR